MPKIRDLNPTSKACIEVFIKEIQDILDSSNCTSEVWLKTELEELLDSWIKGNDLHPENCMTVTTDYFHEKWQHKTFKFSWILES
jgi:hypothetical protein